MAALLHDIGKFYQRATGKKIPHQELSANFVEKYFKDVFPEDYSFIMDLVHNHHEPNKSNYKEITQIIQKADHHSSVERDALDNNVYQEVIDEPLISVFSKIDLRNSEVLPEYYVPLKELNIDSKELYPSDGCCPFDILKFYIVVMLINIYNNIVRRLYLWVNVDLNRVLWMFLVQIEIVKIMEK